MAKATAGYSGTPLRKKLGVAAGQTSWRLAMPASIADDIDGDAPPSMGFVDVKVCAVDAVRSRLKLVIGRTER